MMHQFTCHARKRQILDILHGKEGNDDPCNDCEDV